MNRLAGQPTVADALRALRDGDDETMRSLVEIVQIPAPSFQEQARAEWFRRKFMELGLDVETDEAGNVIAAAKAAGPRGAVVVAAHLDTVFPVGTDLRVVRQGDRLRAPGIADNARGLAAVLAIARASVVAGLVTERPLVFATTVGEEGLGDLQGVKHLFREGSAWRDTAAFISLDGSGHRRIVNRAVGSRRLRVTFRGPGGHSWADWGVVNPIHSLGLVLAELARLRPPRQPRTALTAGRIRGGTSVNAIPSEAWIELDLRSESPETVAQLERTIQGLVDSARADADHRRTRGTEPLESDIAIIGDRPAAQTPADSPLVRAARAATRWIGETPELVASSTDANVPMALGIPSIAIGAGGESGGTHTSGEWYRNERGPQGIQRALLTAVAAAGAPGA